MYQVAIYFLLTIHEDNWQNREIFHLLRQE